MLDVADAVRFSRVFYRQHNLEAFADALPRKPTLDAVGQDLLAFAVRSGFYQAFAFPPFALQMRHLSELVEATARAHAAQLPDNKQYVEPSLSDGWSKEPNGKVLQRDTDLGPREGCYLFVFAPDPLTNCWGKTAKQIQEQFQAKSWHGMTVPEYLVLQRIAAERHGDHRFFDTPENPDAHWVWLIDSMTDTDCSVAMGNARGINIQATGINNRESRRGTFGAVVCPLV